jgi:hypothetical protein
MGLLFPQGQAKAPPLLTTNRAGGINTARQVIYQVFSKYVIITARGPTRSPGELTTVQVLYRNWKEDETV